MTIPIDNATETFAVLQPNLDVQPVPVTPSLYADLDTRYSGFKDHVLIAAVVAVIVLLVGAIPAAHGEGHATDDRLKSLKPVIETLLSDVEGASVALNRGGLEAAYRVQDFQVHPVMRDGKVSDTARTERGPNKGGFLLRVTIRPDPRYTGPVMLSPQGYGTIGHPYWQVQVREIRLPKSHEHVWVNLAMGLNADTTLIHALQSAVQSHLLAAE